MNPTRPDAEGRHDDVLALIPDATGGAARPGVVDGTDPEVTSAAEPFRLAEPATAHVRVTDLALTRGDGVFETVGVFDARPAQLDEHLDRLQRSAAMLDMPTVDLGVVRAAFEAAVEAHPRVPEMLGRILISRGLEGEEVPSGWVHAAAAPDFSRAREGIRVLAVDRGIPSTAPATSPWLLAGAKTLSYAINMACQREAKRRSADDALFVSSDGYALEGPTSTLLVRRGDTFVTTPEEAGVLPGTSLAACAPLLASRGWELTAELLTPAQVAESDGAWLLSSSRLAAPISHLVTVDGPVAQLPVDAELSAALCRAIRGEG